jgi:hypothetical protein
MGDVVTNKMLSEDKNFIGICEKAGVVATKRQASKFRMGKGLAYKLRNKKGA